MVATTDEINTLGHRIGLEFGALRVILFGSRINDTATKDSDVDLFIIMPYSGSPVEQSVAIRMKLRPKFPVDLIIRSPEEVERRLAMGDMFIRDVLENGQVIYEAHHR